MSFPGATLNDVYIAVYQSTLNRFGPSDGRAAAENAVKFLVEHWVPKADPNAPETPAEIEKYKKLREYEAGLRAQLTGDPGALS